MTLVALCGCDPNIVADTHIYPIYTTFPTYPKIAADTLIHNNTDQEIRIAYFQTTDPSSRTEAILPPGGTSTEVFEIDAELTLEVSGQGADSAQYEFTGPSWMEICYDLVICVGLSDGRLGFSGRNRFNDFTEVADAFPGERVVLDRVSSRWSQVEGFGSHVELIPDGDSADTFVAPDVHDVTTLWFVSIDCADYNGVTYAYVKVMPVPAFILADGEYEADHIVDGGLVGQEVALDVDLKEQDADQYTYAWTAIPGGSASFDDPAAVAPTVTLLDVGTIDLFLTVTEVETGISAETTLKFYIVEYDGPGLMVDAYGWRGRSVGFMQSYSIGSGAIVRFGARAYGSPEVVGEDHATTYVWRQDDANPTKWWGLADECKPHYTLRPSPTAPVTLECQTVSGQIFTRGTYRFHVTATDETGEFSDTDFVEVVVR